MDHGRRPAYTFGTTPVWHDRAEVPPFPWWLQWNIWANSSSDTARVQRDLAAATHRLAMLGLQLSLYGLDAGGGGPDHRPSAGQRRCRNPASAALPTNAGPAYPAVPRGVARRARAQPADYCCFSLRADRRRDAGRAGAGCHPELHHAALGLAARGAGAGRTTGPPHPDGTWLRPRCRAAGARRHYGA